MDEIETKTETEITDATRAIYCLANMFECLAHAKLAEAEHWKIKAEKFADFAILSSETINEGNDGSNQTSE